MASEKKKTKIGEWLKKHGIAIGVSVGLSFGGYFAFISGGTNGVKGGAGKGNDTIFIFEKPHPVDSTKAK